MKRVRGAWLGLGALGVLLLIPFQWPVTIALGVACLIAFVAWGVVLIASIQFLDVESESSASPRSTSQDTAGARGTNGKAPRGATE